MHTSNCKERAAANNVFIKLWLDVKHSTTNLLLWLIEPDVFQMPPLHKHGTFVRYANATL